MIGKVAATHVDQNADDIRNLPTDVVVELRDSVAETKQQQIEQVLAESSVYTVQFYSSLVKSHAPSDMFPFSVPILITDSFERTLKRIKWTDNCQK